jgi:molybdate transport system permease protein
MIGSSLLLSLQTAIVTTVVAFVLGLLVARWRMQLHQGMGLVIDGMIILPLALPPTVVGLSLLLVLGPSSPISSVVNVLFTWPATVVAAFVVSFPLFYLSAYAALDQVDVALVDLARTYGYSEARILWNIMLPLAWPGVATGTILTFVRALGEFGATLMVAGNIPGQTQTLPLAIYSSVEGGSLSDALALSLASAILSLLCVGALGFLRRLGVR